MSVMIEIGKISQEESDQKKVRSWPVWEKEISRFAHSYKKEEWCYFLEGEVIIETETGNYKIFPGDFVIFRTGLSCVWDIRKPVRKHYHFL